MCGIIGTNFIAKKFHHSLETLKNRGPDYTGYLEYHNNQFGHTRLSIIDLQEEANQPMEFDNMIITFNGEIYNYKELIQKENLQCITKSDTEVIIRLYQKYHTDFLNKLNGMFSFCIYNKNKKSFFCARDRYGKKPLYYYNQDNKFIYASTIKSILKLLDDKPNMNMDALHEYLSFMAPINDNTFYEGINKLPAGHYLYFHNQNLTISKYYDIDNIPNKKYTEDELLEKVEKLLIDSVKLRLTSDVEVATFLSGGLDSSLVSALYAKYSQKKINTFCIGYDEHTKYSELPYAKFTAEHIGSNHHEIVMTKTDFIETIDKMIEHTDEPFGDSASIPTYFLSQYINQQGIKVALSGEGSDEIFLGYDNYFKMLQYYQTEADIQPFTLSKEWEYNNRKLLSQNIYQTYGETFTEKQKELLLKNYKKTNLLSNYKVKYPPYKWLTYIDFKIWIAEVLMTKIDKMSMAHSLELRAPFLDYRLVELLLSVEEDLKKGNTNKYLLKEISKKYLPTEIIYRQKKGFSSPFIEWLYEEYKETILETILNVNKKIPIFNEDFVKFIYNEAKEKKFKQHLWHLYIFARWFHKNY